MHTNTPGRTLVRGGHVVDAAAGIDGINDVLVEDGRIGAVGPGLDVAADVVVDAGGALVLPGVVDSHVHLTDISRPDAPRTTAHDRLARAGVTTAVEFFDVAAALRQWPASTAGLTMLGLQGIRPYDGTAARAAVRDEIVAALRGGAVGVKILGGHFPNSPETSMRVIDEADGLGAYCAFHAGTTRCGSNLDGMREAVELADGKPLHLAHTNAYLRGATTGVDEENRAAIDLLRGAPRVVSEAHLAEYNLCIGSVTDGVLDDHIVLNCLRTAGLTTDVRGLEQAFVDGFAHVLDDSRTRPAHLTGEAGLQRWRADPNRTLLNFPVNNRLSAFLQSCARVDGGTLRWDGPGEFVVDAIASDGGSWRNVILERALALVRFGALTRSQMVEKICLRPAALFGLLAKGHLQPGADGDVVVVDPDTARVRTTIACGRIVFDGESVVPGGGKVVTTAEGAAAVRARGIECEVVDLEAGLLRRPAVRS